jgi:hypothetical protein
MKLNGVKWSKLNFCRNFDRFFCLKQKASKVKIVINYLQKESMVVNSLQRATIEK